MVDHRIITFGLTDAQNEIVRANIPAKDYEVFDTDAPTDMLAINATALIIQASALEEEGVEMMFGYYEELNGCTDETVFWLGEPKPPKKLQKFMKCYPSFDAIENNLKYLLLTAHSKSKKASEYSERLVNGLRILSMIRQQPGVTTKELAEKTELSVRSVQRYIADLQAAGEWIEYDRSLRGWKLFHGKSTLLGEVWSEEWD